MKLAHFNQNWESRTAYKTQQLTIDVQELLTFAARRSDQSRD